MICLSGAGGLFRHTKAGEGLSPAWFLYYHARQDGDRQSPAREESKGFKAAPIKHQDSGANAVLS